MKSLAILGSTGSIGSSTLSVVKNNSEVFKISLLSAKSNWEKILNQCKVFKPKYVHLEDKESSKKLKEKLCQENLSTSLIDKKDFLKLISSNEVDVVVAGIVGIAGLRSIYKALTSGKRLLLANKEAYVVAGEILNKAAKEAKADIFPIDSEHSAIHQCLSGISSSSSSLKKVILTGSGGPFLKKNVSDFPKITPEEAIAHPVWSMGKKISVDSSTMMNKGLEVIEAKWLFDLDSEQIDIIVHPEGIVHSLVEFTDNSIIAQLSLPDMKIPIAYGLGFPDRIESFSESLDLEKISQLNFIKPDNQKFPSLNLARKALSAGGTSTALLNAANEVAVEAFLNKVIDFNQIMEIIELVMDTIEIKTVKEIEGIYEADILARELAKKKINFLKN